MGVKILWYVSGPDGSVPWENHGSWSNDYEKFEAQVKNIDRLGYYGALLATDQYESISVTASLAPLTERMKFITALHPGLISPTKLAQIALTLDHFNQGRVLFNAVNGNDQGLASFGMHIPHDERYEYSYEYWDAFKKLYVGDHSGYDGKYIKLAPRQFPPGRKPIGPAKDPFPLWGAGTSEPGVEHSAKILDWYLSFADTPPKLGEKFRRVGKRAEEKGRQLRFGTRLQIIVRETEEEAWAHAQWILDQTSIETAIRLASRHLGPEGLNTKIESDDPKLLRRVQALREGRLPELRDLEVYPNVWVGPSPFGFDILHPWAGTWIVGSAKNVAERIHEFHAQGTDAFIISGWPLISEAQRVADILLPLLDLDHGFELPKFVAEDHREALEHQEADYIWPENEKRWV
ncbi:LLM class flavin-dependent oxidoreductase [Cellvibrio polysaccharolyticus]|uniref:LLM class flavin-dependent oxidoreductase n=1 Tax=Cellvibrio polysaccharolyticus TaxID=2082724 RepID=A0A928V484_9GAMM|nr:LLM class flavin-dependent oxidoreductase [Cellvibrio polysaccharolyticus]MBE8716601.1 LLM class flavin-dependent oxidoreductase [Cellvibrio polysaccharolyticus]